MHAFDRALCSLEGLSVGDAFGQSFFPHWELIAQRRLPKAPWPYTDDTQMALSIVAILHHYGEINQPALAQSFAQHYEAGRGYGAAMHGLLWRIQAGETWETVSRSLFHGQGSFGNGAAMRIAPLGAYFADDLHTAAAQARLAAEVTHAHPEGLAGAIAVAVATALAWQLRGTAPNPTIFLDYLLPLVPAGEVYDKIAYARERVPDLSLRDAVLLLGNGSQISAQDTVPFVIWCATQSLQNFSEALWITASGFGDMDTTCAMVGGIVAAYTGAEGIPAEWIAAREPLPDWYLG